MIFELKTIFFPPQLSLFSNYWPVHFHLMKVKKGEDRAFDELEKVKNEIMALKDNNNIDEVTISIINSLGIFIQQQNKVISSLKKEISVLRPPGNFIHDIFEASKSGHLPSVKYLIEKCGIYIESKDKYNITPLQYALYHRQAVVYDYLLTKLNIQKPDNLEPNIHTAALYGNLTSMKFLHETMSFDINMKNKDDHNRIPLYYACVSKNMDAIKYCDLCMNNNNSLPTNFELDVLKAIKGNNIKSITFLVEKAGFDILDKYDGHNMLQFACLKNSMQIVNYFVKKLNLPQTPEKFQSNIYDAIASEYLMSVMYLYENVGLSDDEKFNAISCALDMSNKISTYLILQGCPIQPARFLELCKETEDPRIKIIELIVSKKDIYKEIIESRDSTEKTALHIAVINNNVRVVKLLIDQCGLDPGSKTKNGETPIMMAIKHGYIEIVDYLIPKVEKKDDLTKLALNSQQYSIYNTLIKHGCNIIQLPSNIKMTSNNMTLHEAIAAGHISLVQYFIEVEKKQDVEFKDSNGYTALHIACENNLLYMVKYLVEIANYNFESRTNSKPSGDGNETPLHIACRKGYLSIIRYLVKDRKANINARDNAGRTPLDIVEASNLGLKEIICDFLKSQVPVPAKPSKSRNLKKGKKNTV